MQTSHSNPVESLKITEDRLLNLDGLDFEYNTWPYILALPLMYILVGWVVAKKKLYSLFSKGQPKVNSFWFDGIGSLSRKLKESATSSQALGIVYNYRPQGFKQGLGGMVDDFWSGLRNAQAVRNRVKLIELLLIKEFRNQYDQRGGDSPLRAVSLAAGSAPGMLQAIAHLNELGVRVEILLIDIDPEALENARLLAQSLGISTEGYNPQLITLEKNVLFCHKDIKRFKPHVIEMLGLLDYLDADLAIRIIKVIHSSLQERGTFFTCNINFNREMCFLEAVIDWPQIYRSPEQLRMLLINSKFSECDLYFEPHNIQTVARGRK